MVEKFTHKDHFYSLEQCKEFMKNMSGNVDYAKDEGILTSCVHYLEQYEDKLRKEYISKIPMLFWVEYIGDTGFYDGATKDNLYPVLEELENQYVIKNDYGDISTLEKIKFNLGTK